MATMKTALQAKEKAKELLSGLRGVDGIGVAWDEDGQPCVRVNVEVDAEESRQKIPAFIEGVPVLVEIIRHARLE